MQDVLEACVREGARKILVAVLEEEVAGFLERLCYQRSKQFRSTGMVTIHCGQMCLNWPG